MRFRHVCKNIENRFLSVRLCPPSSGFVSVFCSFNYNSCLFLVMIQDISIRHISPVPLPHFKDMRIHIYSSDG